MSWRAQGMRTWIMQRLTAVYMLVYLLGFVYLLSCNLPLDYGRWREMFTHPFANIATTLFFYTLLYHAWVGIRDILIDYIHWSPLRYLLWVSITLSLLGLGIWVTMILYSVVEL